VALISYELWQSAFGARPVVGQSVDLDGRRIEVVGVTVTIYRKKQILAAEELVQHGIRGDLPQWPQPSDRAD
jgi:hypothetical protein